MRFSDVVKYARVSLSYTIDILSRLIIVMITCETIYNSIIILIIIVDITYYFNNISSLL